MMSIILARYICLYVYNTATLNKKYGRNNNPLETWKFHKSSLHDPQSNISNEGTFLQDLFSNSEANAYSNAY